MIRLSNQSRIYLLLTLAFMAGLNGCSTTEETKEYPSAAIKVLYEDDPEALTQEYKDLDEDGVTDKLDHCQNTVPGIKVDSYGCELDSDGDGVYDKDDQCPGTPPGVKVNSLGCEPDDDRDGVANSIDLCPDTPLGTPVDEKGCPLDMDEDRDGVFNDDDQCPGTPLGVKVNKYGCPPEVLVLSNIVFDTNSSKIRDDQAAVLKQNASRLKTLKSTEVILVTGHTDSVGSNQYNLWLSWRRADSAKEFLLNAMQLKDDQLYILGKGEEAPIADNKTAEGRQKNRRIELKVIPRTEVPDAAKARLPENIGK
ncbi:OmpA family protein [Thiomicrorhabdus sp. ZW0627]|uniref:OmpA family protein n=1 Tax=Thiomicrorhabdus sp. ZW0627 TaxID=3039774 RepID=UPI0024365C61|nr:OmpA family protein [Thiomicrorhabdus sp. ZW0627]MDG6774467.1 OmpA family protein [Thiomicrorhabdus sp. ZW0627]